MKKLLIVESSGTLADLLAPVFGSGSEIRSCCNGLAALGLLHSFHPDMLIIELRIQELDGLSVLQQSEYVPAMTIAIADYTTPFMLQCLKDVGVGLILHKPFSTEALIGHMKNMIRICHLPGLCPDPQQIIREHLRILGIPEDRVGFRHLCVGVPLFAQNRRQSLSKELYPAIMTLCGSDNTDQVECTIRRLIADSWKTRCAAVWEDYFPGLTKSPHNKLFFSVLADRLDFLYQVVPMAQSK